MIERLRRRRGQEGFTLIELLVVVIIIGLLAAIAIPMFLGQRDKANEASAKSAVRIAATAAEAAYVENQAYPATADHGDLNAIEPTLVFNDAAAGVLYQAASGGYTIDATRGGQTCRYTKPANSAATIQCPPPGP